jgi:hypothetical protein
MLMTLYPTSISNHTGYDPSPRVVPLDLELDLLHAALSLVLDVERRTVWNGDPLVGDLDAESFSAFQRIGKASQLGHELGGGVGSFDIALFLLGHGMPPFDALPMDSELHRISRQPYLNLSKPDKNSTFAKSSHIDRPTGQRQLTARLLSLLL